MATSDRGFRTVIRRHREKANLPPAAEEALDQIEGIDKIPDLFLASEREYTGTPRPHQRLLVELKRPTVDVGPEEVQQIRGYQGVVVGSDEWDQDKSFWTLFVVSSSLKPNVERERSQLNLQHGCLGEWQNCRLWAFTWGEIIDRAKEELNGVREHLAHKSKELKIAEHLRENFPHLGIRTEDQSDRADATDGSGRRQQKTSAP